MRTRNPGAKDPDYSLHSCPICGLRFPGIDMAQHLRMAHAATSAPPPKSTQKPISKTARRAPLTRRPYPKPAAGPLCARCHQLLALPNEPFCAMCFRDSELSRQVPTRRGPIPRAKVSRRKLRGSLKRCPPPCGNPVVPGHDRCYSCMSS